MVEEGGFQILSRSTGCSSWNAVQTTSVARSASPSLADVALRAVVLRAKSSNCAREGDGRPGSGFESPRDPEGVWKGERCGLAVGVSRRGGGGGGGGGGGERRRKESGGRSLRQLSRQRRISKRSYFLNDLGGGYEVKGEAMTASMLGQPLPPVREETFDEMNSLDDAMPQKRRSEVARKLVGASKKVMERCKSLHEAASAYSGRLKTDADSLGEEASSLESEINQLKNAIASAVENDEITPDLAEALDDDLDRSRSIVYEGDVAALLPHKRNGPFLRLLLGHVNVLAARRDVRLKVKDEYNSYRDRTALLFFAFASCLLLLMRKVDGCVPGILLTAYMAWLLFFYTSLALRENILRINGSDIRPWWIQHHYFAMGMAVVSLTWGLDGDDCLRKQENMKLFLMWAVMQGVVMLLQNRYQRRRLYTRIALGKAGRMDVVWGESAGVKGQIWLLYPSLFVLQGFQLYMGLLLLRSALYEVWEWQIAVCGILLIIMAIGNFANTVATLVTKARIKARMKRKILQQFPAREYFKKQNSL